MYDPDGVTLSDHLSWIDPNDNPLACTSAASGPPCATHMLFYSMDDLNGQKPSFTATKRINENPDGSFVYVGSVNVNTFDGLSDIPLPAALPLFASGLAGLGLLGWRRKKAT